MYWSRNRHPVHLILFAFWMALLSGCQTTGQDTGSSQPTTSFQVARDNYTIFFDQKDHLKELVDQQNFSNASILYEEQREHFDAASQSDEELAVLIAETIDNVSAPHIAAIEAARQKITAVEWPTPTSRWKEAREALQNGQRVYKEVPHEGVFANAAYRPDSLAKLKSDLEALSAKIKSTTLQDFNSFDIFGDQNFFDLYPTSDDAGAFFTEHPGTLRAKLSGQTPQNIRIFAEKLGRQAFRTDQWKIVSGMFTDARISSLSAKDRSLSGILDVIRDAKTSGFDVENIDAVDIGFVEVTSRTLLNEGQVEFPASVEVDLPFKVSKGELEDALGSNVAVSSDYLIVFDVALAKTRRKIGRMQKQRSEVIVGYKQEPNPEHARLNNELTMAQMELQSAAMNVATANSQYCSGWGCLGKIASVAIAASSQEEAQKQVQEIIGELNSTKMMIEVPIKRPYNYEVAHIDASKTMTVHYYVIDHARKRYFKSTFDVVENEKFEVAYRIADSDPNKSQNAAKHQVEDDVIDWEKKPSTVKLSQLINHYLDNESNARRFASIESLRTEMLKDRNTAIAEYKANTFEESTNNDPRFDSVVAIYLPSGGLGSGFFVTPDVVMTNYHVVEEGDFAELKMHDEQETFGKVIARDAGLDLALIRVQARGKPVRFFDQNKIELGSTVEVIGHPRGYEFSITRGVVSAIRNQKSVNLAAGGDVLQVQIDAATSPGNSGGPVFMKDYVISVVSWGRVDQGSENLNFTIHHSEAQRFLRDALGSSS